MYKLIFKPLFDLIFAVVLSPIIIVLVAILAPIIYLDDPGPVFYVSQRVGKNGKPFFMYKFRSMKANAPDIRNPDGSTFNSDNDFRLTRVGKVLRKTSIDETPQIINVLKGEMSFIGPRPNLPNKTNQYFGIEKDRLKIRPGITGYSQAIYRNSISVDERYQNDIKYISNISFVEDLKIVVMTITSVFAQRNINIKK